MNRALGVGEPPAPEPFTLEQRYHDAARRGDRRTLELALERGAPVDAQDDLGRSALLLAISDAGSLEIARWLRAKGAAIDEPDHQGRTPISFAAARGHLDAVRELAAWGAQIDRQDADGRTPLFHAVLGDHRDVVAFLLDAGAAVDAADRFGDTPLMMACGKGYAGMAAYLVERGADPALHDQEGRSASDRAAAHGTTGCPDARPR